MEDSKVYEVCTCNCINICSKCGPNASLTLFKSALVERVAWLVVILPWMVTIYAVTVCTSHLHWSKVCPEQPLDHSFPSIFVAEPESMSQNATCIKPCLCHPLPSISIKQQKRVHRLWDLIHAGHGMRPWSAAVQTSLSPSVSTASSALMLRGWLCGSCALMWKELAHNVQGKASGIVVHSSFPQNKCGQLKCLVVATVSCGHVEHYYFEQHSFKYFLFAYIFYCWIWIE